LAQLVAVCSWLAVTAGRCSWSVSGADFASAVVDEIETPAHHREHLGVAY
jgi:putative NADH-flavin reductase